MVSDRFNRWIDQKNMNKVLVSVAIMALIMASFLVFVFPKFRLLSNNYFDWFFVFIIIFLFVFIMLYFIRRAKENTLYMIIVIFYFIVILLVVITLFALIFKNPDSKNCLADHGTCIWTNSSQENLLNAMYFSTITLTTVGYGDIHPIGSTFKKIAMVEAIMGYMFIVVFLTYAISKVKE